MNGFKIGLIFLLYFALLISPVSADSDNEDKTTHVIASDFVFVYEDIVSENYKCDIGLDYLCLMIL